MTRARKWLIGLPLVLAAVLALAVLTGPARSRQQAGRFVDAYADALEPLLEADLRGPLPVLPEVVSYNVWQEAQPSALPEAEVGSHPMGEFLLKPRGAVYTGCYYSPDDVPLAFQNLRTALLPDGENRWRWEGNGDNRGMTQKLRDRWYYFEASF